MLEFVFATLLALSIILGIMQIALVFNAHHMVQLAAFNAARAAIVTRNADSSKPEEPTDLQEMQGKAQLAAFITLLPVIPDLHGALPTSLTPSAIQNLFQNLFSLNPADPQADSGLAGFGERAAGIALEYLAISVKFVRVDDKDAKALLPADIQAMAGGQDQLEFDDHDLNRATSGATRSAPDNNLIKVIVSWNYPLVIPFANRIFFAATNFGLGSTTDILGVPVPTSYPLVWIASHPEFAQANPILTFRLLTGDSGAIPVWGLGLEYETFINRTFGTGFTGRLARRLLYRVPVKASYIMRMQWDRKP
jgi:hypothetical protein